MWKPEVVAEDENECVQVYVIYDWDHYHDLNR